MLSIGSHSQTRSYLQAAEQLRRNDEQWQAYESTGNCVVLAGPGSGKTKVLTIKMARMLKEDIAAPQGVACLTYSNECARELRRRLRGLGVSEARTVFTGTTHGFCLQHVLKPYGKIANAGLPDPPKVASLRQQAIALQRAIDEILPYQERESNYRASTLDRYRTTYLDRSSPSWSADDPHAAAVVERYEELLHEEGLVDFDDMVLAGLRLLEEHHWIRRAIKCRFPILVVDEYQDLGPPLHEIVLVLLREGVRVLAVGDPDQSIYGFTGANPKLLEQLSERDDVEDVRLKLNYRSRQLIVEGSLVVLGEDRGYEQAPDEEETSEEGIIDFVECPEGLDQQAAITLDQLVPTALKARDGRQLGDIAILYPNRNIGDVIAGVADRRAIPVVRIDQGAAYPRTPFTRWVEDCASWCAGGWLSGEPRLSSIVYWWSNVALPRASAEARWQERVKIVAFLWQNREPKTSLSAWLKDMYEGVLEEFLGEGSERQDEIAAWEKLWAACSEGGELAEWTVDMFGGQVGSPDHLNLITLHSAKGLEFDVVVMMGMDQGIIPPWWAETDDAKREPRRLFYVGMTRARHEVYMTYSGFTVNPRGTKFNNGPSEYLSELQEALKDQQK